MNKVTRLPNRPLRRNNLVALEEDSLKIAPSGDNPDGENIQIYAVKLATDDTAHALGYDDSSEQWLHLGSVAAKGLVAAYGQLDAAFDDWVQETYGGRFDEETHIRCASRDSGVLYTDL